MGSIYRERIDPINAFHLSHPNLGVVHDQHQYHHQNHHHHHHHHQIPNMAGPSQLPSVANPEEAPLPCDYFHGVYEYIKQMLLEEDDLDHRPCMLQDCSALQACEKYFYDALSDKSPVHPSTGSHRALSNPDINNHYPSGFLDDIDGLLSSPGSHFSSLNPRGIGQESCHGSDSCINPRVQFRQGSHVNDDSNGKRTHDREEGNDTVVEGRKTKQLAGFVEELPEATEEYDTAFLCEKMNPGFYDEELPDLHHGEVSGDEVETKYRKLPEVKRGRPKGSTKKKQAQKQCNVKEVVDLRTLLTRCAQAVLSYDHTGAQEILMKIRQHSSPYGDGNERLAHCFANALEARLAATGSMLYSASVSRRVTALELLKAYQTYVTACPFKRMSNIFANKMIARHTREADKIHIVDFGILYGFQWPCIIQGVSLRPGGPPTLRITGIDYPQPGLKPAERVEQTGRRLMDYCKRFNVPFEYNAIAKKWEDVTIDDLKLDRDEMLVANCLYRLRHVPDESAGMDSPRDTVLKLINRIKPHIFVHGIVNGSYNAPFFTTRFREVLYYYSSLFDMMEATMPREDQDRLMYEREVFGRDVMNVIACEGSERVDRPESYKQWQVRNQRAGFWQLPLNREITEEVKLKVRKGYQSDFMVEEDGEWMLQGWKGRALYGLSCWKPLEE